MEKEKKKIKIVEVNEETHTRLKVLAAQHKITIGKFIKVLLDRPYIPKSEPGAHNE